MSVQFPEPPTDEYCCMATSRGLECTCPPDPPADEDEYIADWQQRVDLGELDGYDEAGFYTQFERLASGE